MNRVFKLAASIPWAIEIAMLRTILTIAAGEGPGPEAVAEKLGRKLDNSRTVTMRDGVAIIPIVGPIMRYANVFSDVSGATSISSIALDLRTAIDDPNVKAILFDVNSPGGEVTGVSELAGQIMAARGKKPIGAYIGGVGASAAYWLSSAAEVVIANDTARVGSIGVVQAMPNPAADTAADVEIVSSNAPAKRPDITTDAGRAEIQRMVDALEQVFVQAVADQRGTTTKKVLADFGRGGVLVGQAAKDAGMVDSIGTFEGAIATMKRRAARASQENKRMSMKMKLGLAEAATDQELEAAVDRLVAVEKSFLEATGATTSAAAMGVIESWKTSASQLAEEREKVRALEKDAEDREKREILAKLDAENRITPAQMKAFAERPLEFVKAFAETAPTIKAFAEAETKEPADGSGAPLTFKAKGWPTAKTWADMKFAERAVVKAENPEMYAAMRLDADRRKAAAK